MAWELEDGDIYNYKVDDYIILKLYPDNRPSNLETSLRQKGVVMEYQGRPVIGEGMGFGVPLVKYKEKTFFPGSSTITHDSDSITKTFMFNTVSRKYYHGNLISDRLYRPVHRTFAYFYLKLKPLRALFDYMMSLRESAGIQTSFVRIEPRGKASITYSVAGRELIVRADFSEIQMDNIEELVVLNEQGATDFTSYTDSNGIEAHNEKIGAWDRVEADSASLLNATKDLCFTLWRIPEASLFRGWEKVQGRLSWAGLNYTFSPKCKQITFKIGIHPVVSG